MRPLATVCFGRGAGYLDQEDEMRDMDERFLLADAAYERGQYEEAFSMFLELAKDSHLNGMARVACMYSDGEGTARSLDKSLEWDEGSSSR